MTYNFSTRLDRCGTRMKQLHDNCLTYARGTNEVVIENFTPEKIDVDQLQALGIAIINEKWQDFVFDYSALEDLPSQDPQINDLITWDDGESPVRQYRVFSINDELYKFTTSSRKRIRVHTKQTN